MKVFNRFYFKTFPAHFNGSSLFKKWEFIVCSGLFMNFLLCCHMVVLSFIMLLIDIPTIPSFFGPAHKFVLSYSTFFIFLNCMIQRLKSWESSIGPWWIMEAPPPIISTRRSLKKWGLKKIQELMQALAAWTPSPHSDALKNWTSTGLQSTATPPVSSPILTHAYWISNNFFHRFIFLIFSLLITAERKDWSNSLETPAQKIWFPRPDSKPWQAFGDKPKQQQPLSRDKDSV